MLRNLIYPQLIDQLMADIVSSAFLMGGRSELMITTMQIEVTESLASKTSSAHALNILSQAQHKGNTHENSKGKLEAGEGSASSGTYAKTC